MKNKGFTLIELLLVIAIIGVIATALLTVINPGEQQRRAKDTKIKQEISKIAQAGESYAALLGSYGYVDPATEIPSSGTWYNADCWTYWGNFGFAKGSLPFHPDGNQYELGCSNTGMYIRGYSNGDGWHYGSSDGLIHEEGLHW
jgi:prepilin-type N-terminal cleavage/methylation domain-containing protein